MNPKYIILLITLSIGFALSIEAQQLASVGEGWANNSVNVTVFKRIPISRPQIVAKSKKGKTSLYLFYRDEERGSKVSMAACKNIKNNDWEITDITSFSVGSWELTFDTELWRIGPLCSKSRANRWRRQS